eukprot:TRINITY_DN1109_c0_g3_i1.p1 TRINITY_DN1109_c0_g3~~TRINITY_DN1109_c0_g3_i1.p1  ORF type:complete len:485 (+),score=122.07 TRINITY_DN1109_c0_g3_i1:164-1456(+)
MAAPPHPPAFDVTPPPEERVWQLLSTPSPACLERGGAVDEERLLPFLRHFFKRSCLPELLRGLQSDDPLAVVGDASRRSSADTPGAESPVTPVTPPARLPGGEGARRESNASNMTSRGAAYGEEYGARDRRAERERTGRDRGRRRRERHRRRSPSTASSSSGSRSDTSSSYDRRRRRRDRDRRRHTRRRDRSASSSDDGRSRRRRRRRSKSRDRGREEDLERIGLCLRVPAGAYGALRQAKEEVEKRYGVVLSLPRRDGVGKGYVLGSPSAMQQCRAYVEATYNDPVYAQPPASSDRQVAVYKKRVVAQAMPPPHGHGMRGAPPPYQAPPFMHPAYTRGAAPYPQQPGMQPPTGMPGMPPMYGMSHGMSQTILQTHHMAAPMMPHPYGQHQHHAMGTPAHPPPQGYEPQPQPQPQPPVAPGEYMVEEMPD